jgi:exonuclease SbcD
MLGGDLVLPGSLVRDRRLDYVALGHIHKPQNLNPNAHPPVVYPGSIERVDFGEASDEKFFVIAHVERGHTRVDWRKLTGIRPFVDRYLLLEQAEGITGQLIAALPAPEDMQEAIVRLVLEYPRDWEALIDDAALREHTAGCFEFHLIKRPQVATRIRLPGDQAVGSLSSLQLLDLYWKSNHVEKEENETLGRLAAQVIREAMGE